MDITVLQSSVEAIASRANFITLLASIEIQRTNYEQLRDQNDFGSAASALGAQALRNSHLQQADQFHQRYIESAVQASAAGLMGAVHIYGEVRFAGRMEAAQAKVDTSQAYLNEINDRIEDPRPRVVAVIGDDGRATTPGRATDLETRIQQIMRQDMDQNVDFKLLSDKAKIQVNNGSKYQLNTRSKEAFDGMRKDELEKCKKQAKAANKKANKEVRDISQNKQTMIQTWQIAQQLISSTGSAIANTNQAKDEAARGEFEYLRALLQWTQEAFQLANQITNTAIGQQNERMSGIIQTMGAIVQANRAA